VRDPIRLDSQLFDLFVSRHPTSGVEVLASPRQRDASTELTIPALDALFGFISERYDLVIIDLPERYQEWTSLILSICDLVIITGLNNVPGLRRIGESMKFINTAARSPPQIALVLNRCETDLFGRPRHSQHVNRFLGQNKVLFVREDPTAATESVNTGIPVSIANSSSKIAKDVRAVASLVTAAWTGQGRLSEPLKLTFFRGEKVTPNRD
jgi:Flp pilus assembly CpaE family ATPase